MTTPNKCGVCNQPFESERDLQEQQESAHPAKQGVNPNRRVGTEKDNQSAKISLRRWVAATNSSATAGARKINSKEGGFHE
jgi:hypothetical protein